MWTYEVATGRMVDPAKEVVGIGYSGGGCGTQPSAANNPAAQQIKLVGPIPIGMYIIGPPIDTVTHGPYVLGLRPYLTNEMFGRSGFLIHGDSVINPGKMAASDGCIILSRDVRELIGESTDHDLQVVSGILTGNEALYI